MFLVADLCRSVHRLVTILFFGVSRSCPPIHPSSTGGGGIRPCSWAERGNKRRPGKNGGDEQVSAIKVVQNGGKLILASSPERVTNFK